MSYMYRYEAQLEKDWTYILKDSGAKMLLVSTDAIYEKTKGYIVTVRIMTTVTLTSYKSPTIRTVFLHCFSS